MLILSLTLGIGIALGAFGDRFLSAQQQPVKRTELLKTDLEEMAGKEEVIYIAKLASGAATGKHFHPEPEFAYVLEDALILEPQGKVPMTIKAGEAFHNASKIVRNAKNASASATAPR